MIYALRLGDLETREGPASVYLGLGAGRVLRPVLGQSDEDGVRRLLAQAEGEEVVCHPALAAAATHLVLSTAPQPAWTRVPCAELASAFHLGPALERPGVAAIVPAIVAACDFVAAAPWDRLEGDLIDFVVERAASASRSYEGCILGPTGQQFGVALYDQPGALGRVVALSTAGRLSEAARVDVLVLTIDDEPGWVAEAVEAAFEWPVVISPGRVRRGAARPVGLAELTILAAATAAAARLDPEHLEATATAGDGDDAVTVVARVRPKSDRPAPAPPRPFRGGDRKVTRLKRRGRSRR